MEMDSQAHPHPAESESARERAQNPGNKEEQREARAQRAQPPPRADAGLCPSPKIPKEVWLGQGQWRQIWDPSQIY